MLPFPYDCNSNILFLTCVTACITRLNYVQSINMSPYPIHLNIIVPIIDPPYAGTYIFFQNIRSGWNPTWASTMSTVQHLALADLSWSILAPEKRVFWPTCADPNIFQLCEILDPAIIQTCTSPAALWKPFFRVEFVSNVENVVLIPYLLLLIIVYSLSTILISLPCLTEYLQDVFLPLIILSVIYVS